MKRNLLIVVAVLMAAVMLFAGCSPSPDSAEDQFYARSEAAEAPAAEAPEEDSMADMNMANEKAEALAEEGYTEDTADAAGGTSLGLDSASSILEPSVDRKIIYTGNVEARTKNFEEDYQNILDSLAKSGGYIENANISGTKPEQWDDQGRYASMTLRVPSKQFDAFIKMLNGLGETISSSVSGQDVSLQYYDRETKLSIKRIREERLLTLLEEAKGMEDIIELERELEEVSNEIHMLETELRSYDSLIDFSTVTVYLQEVHDVAQVTPSEKTLGERISTGFYGVLNVLADIGEGLLVFFLAGWPVLLLIGGITFLIVWLVKRSEKKRKAKTQAALEAKNRNAQGEPKN